MSTNASMVEATMNKLPSTAVIDPPALESTGREMPSTAVVARDTVLPLDPNESDEDWEERILNLCSRPRVILALRD
jgi:hypothetical protein